MICELEKNNSILDIIDTIKGIFANYNKNLYLPAIIKEGNFLYSEIKNDENKNTSDFYSKLIIRPKNSKITHSWLVENLAYRFYNGNDYAENENINPLDFAYNIIVNKNVYNNLIYTLNPLLYDDTSLISEENYKNNEIANLYYCDSSDIEKKMPVLKKENNDIYILKKILKDYENYDYILSVEFEYRNKNKHINDEKSYQDDSCFIDNIKSKDGFLWLIGTIDIPLIIEEERPLNIIVNDLSGQKRPINEHNYNDDIDAGLIVFSEDCFEYLRKRYIILGLNMIDTYNDKNAYLIDNLNDIFVFWEGEFNKLPREIKEGLEQYNIGERSKEIISPAMFDWQLNANWDWKEKANPSQLLGRYLLENCLELVKEYKCNVVLPKNEDLFKEEMINILNILELEIEDISEDEKSESLLCKILDGEYLGMAEIKLKSLFEYFCYIVLKKVDKEYAK